MNLPNPFKKKEDNEFRLNEQDLPSLNELSAPNNDFSQNMPSNQDQLSLPPMPSPSPFGSDNSGINSGFSTSEDDNEPISSQTNQVSIRSWEKPDFGNKKDSNQGDNVHAQISKSKLDTIEAKVTLIDARLYAMEQKIEMMFQMISNEVSEETRRKFRLDSMMKNIRDTK